MSVLDALKKELNDHIVGIIGTKEEDPEFENFEKFYNKEIYAFLKSLGFNLYKHQKIALDLLYSGKNVVITTQTASGKSEIFRLYILDNYLKNPMKTFLLIYPTRALLYDQYEKLLERINEFSKIKKINIKVSYILGDLTYKEKEKIIKEQPNIILTTIDNLHLFLLKNHEKLFYFFKNLDLIVVDEIHTYRGVFGTNAAYVFRRLFRLLKYFYKNNKFKVLALSATLSNAKEFCKKLFGLEFEEVNKDYSKKYKKYYIIIDPKTHKTRSILKRVIRILLENKIKSLVFLESKKGVELSKISLEDIDKEGKVFIYKASLPREKRREIEKKFKEGKYLILITTSALELGIDIGDVKAVVNIGIPRDGLFSLIQRFGRAGRKSEGYNILIFKKDALDFYYYLNKRELFDKLLKNKVEDIPVNLNNENVVKRHLLYLAKELGKINESILSNHEKDILKKLEGSYFKKFKDPIFRKEYYKLTKDVEYIGLRNISDKVFILLKYNEELYKKLKMVKKEKTAFKFYNILKSKGLIIEEMDEEGFYSYLLPGMIYYSSGISYRILDLIKIGKITFVFAKKDKYSETYPIYNEEVKVLEDYKNKKFLDWEIHLGKIKVKKSYLGYIEKVYENYKINYYEKSIDREFITKAIWIIIPEEYKNISKEYLEYFKKRIEDYIRKKGYRIDFEFLFNLASTIDKEFLYEKYRGLTTKKTYEIIKSYLKKIGIEDKKLVFYVKKLSDYFYAFQSGLHAIEHNIIKISPVITNVDSKELGGYSYPMHPDLKKPVIFIYEGYEGGIGLAEILYENIEKLLKNSRKSLYKCRCLDGCPRCILSTKCGNFNEFLDKYAGRFIYKKLFSKAK